MERNAKSGNASMTNAHDWLDASKHGDDAALRRQNLSIGITLGIHKGSPVFQLNRDRFRHTLILGRTGSGKSNLVQQMEREDVRSGAGTFILAAHEEDALYAISCVPDARLGDVILIDAANPVYLPCLNPLDVDGMGEAERAKRIDEISELLTMDCEWDWAGPRFESYLRGGIGLLMSAEQPSEHRLADLQRLYTDPEYVKPLLAGCTDRSVYDHWTKVIPEAMRSSDSGQVVDWFLSKVSRFASDRVLRAVFGSGRSSIDVQAVVDEGKILVAYVPESRIGSTAARTVSKWLVMRLRDAIMRRRGRSGGWQGLDYGLFAGSERHSGGSEGDRFDPFFVYVDEFAKFATPDFEVLLAEARKQGVGFVLSTQTLSQTRSFDIRHGKTSGLEEAVLGNVGTMICYPVGAGDARLLADQLDIDVDRLRRIPRYRPLARLCVDNRTGRPDSLEVPLRPEPDNPEAPMLVARNQVLSGAWVEVGGGEDKREFIRVTSTVE